MRYFMGPASGVLYKVLGNTKAYWWFEGKWLELQAVDAVTKVLQYKEFN